MTTDRLFVILLVMLIPMTGCFGAIDNADSEETDQNEVENQPPVFYGEFFRLTSSCPVIGDSCSTDEWIYPSIVGDSMILDYDGQVVSVGLDIDRDLTIDYEFSTNDNYSTYTTIGFVNISGSDLNPVLLDNWDGAKNDPDSNCYQWVNIIAIDDDGAKTIHPNRWTFGWNTQDQVCNNNMDWE